MAYANASRPMGFIPKDDGGRANAIDKRRPFTSPRHVAAGGNASTDLAVGDAYALDANGFAYRAGPNDVVRGVVIGVEFDAVANVMNGNGPVSVDFITGTQTGFIIGREDPAALFVVQADTLAQNQVGGAFNLADGAPDALFRQSRQTLNVGAGLGVQFRVEQVDESDADNTYGANARALVRCLQTLNN